MPSTTTRALKGPVAPSPRREDAGANPGHRPGILATGDVVLLPALSLDPLCGSEVK